LPDYQTISNQKDKEDKEQSAFHFSVSKDKTNIRKKTLSAYPIFFDYFHFSRFFQRYRGSSACRPEQQALQRDNCHTNACMPQRERHFSCLQKTRNQHPEKYVSLPAKDSFPPAGSKQEKKLSRLTDFYTLAPPAVLYFPRKAVSLYQQTRELEARFSSRPIRKPVPSPSTSLPESFRKLETDRHFCLTKKTG